jgi:cytochrome c5
MSRNPLVNLILGAITSMMLSASAYQTRAAQFTRTRSRDPGKPQPAGTKLARLAQEHRVGTMTGKMCHLSGWVGTPKAQRGRKAAQRQLKTATWASLTGS